MEEAIGFNNYEKISDDLFFIGYNVVLRFNVILSKKLQDGKKYSFHHEYKYKSNKYLDYNELATIRRQFDYYMTIENERAINGIKKEFIMIRLQDIIYVQDCFKSASMWFRSKKYENLFAKKDNKLYMVNKVEPILIRNLAMEKYIKLEPIIITYENGSQNIGVRLTLSSENNFIDISVDKLMALVYLFNSINMYESAQLMLNYIQRPEYGTNSYTFQRESDIYDEGQEHSECIETKTTRKIQVGPKRQKSFFEKMDDL